MSGQTFLRDFPAEAVPRSGRAALEALAHAAPRARRAFWDFALEAVDTFQRLDDDPLHRPLFALLLDVIQRSRLDPELERDEPLAAALHRVLVAADAARSRSQNGRGDAAPVDPPHAWEEFAAWSRPQRLAYQRQAMDAAEQEFTRWAGPRLAEAAGEAPGLVLNVSDQMHPSWDISRSFVGHSLLPRCAALRAPVRHLVNGDIQAVVGADADAQRRSRLEAAFGPWAPRRFETVRLDLRATPFEAQTFDVALSHGVLDHLVGHALALAELARVTRVGGVVSLSGHRLAASRAERWIHQIGHEAHYSLDAGCPTGADPEVILAESRRLPLRLVGRGDRPHAWFLTFVRTAEGTR